MSAFAGKVVLVTGGTSGIGAATAAAFARAGAKVVVSGRREREGRAVVEGIRSTGGDAHFVRADVAVEADVKALVEEAVSRYGRLDVAFNNAGVEFVGPLAAFEEADFRRVFDTNVLGLFLSLKYEIPAMLRTGGGAVVNMSSVAGHAGMPGAAVYIASKHAVEGITKTAAVEYARHGVRVNAVAPGSIQTEMIDRFTGSEAAKAYYVNLHPLGRIGRPDEVAAAVLYLASDAASFVTGVSLRVDGGYLTP